MVSEISKNHTTIRRIETIKTALISYDKDST